MFSKLIPHIIFFMTAVFLSFSPVIILDAAQVQEETEEVVQKEPSSKKNGWIKENGKWYYYSSAEVRQTGWKKISSKWYYLDSAGVMQTGWQKVNNTWYYLSSSGIMQTGLIDLNSKTYYLSSSGAMRTGWLKTNNKWYYFNSSGAMSTGWIKLNNKWYYLNSTGVMQTGWAKVSHKWYYMNSSGVMQTGWIKLSGKWYYLNSSGAMQTGWIKLSGKWYYLNSSGAMQTGWVKISGKWYYMNSSGVMQTGHVTTGGVTYYLNSSGLYEDFYFKPLTSDMQKYITGVSYSSGCPVTYEQLRYLQVQYYDFNGKVHTGELICNNSIAKDLVEIFNELYHSKYPLAKIELVEKYDGDDEASMADNNTSAFNHRPIEGTSKASKHSYGLAVDINPKFNPYIATLNGKKVILPSNAVNYVDRTKNFAGKIDKNDLCYKLFIKHGFSWGGSWNSLKDFQHFEK